MRQTLSLLLVGCSPYASWPDEGETYPWRYTPEPVEDYEAVRVETETWTPLVDIEQTGLYLKKSLEHRPGAPFDSEVHFGLMRSAMLPLVEADAQLSLVGDVMWLGGGWSEAYDAVAHLLDGDLRIGNLETPVSSVHPTQPGNLPSPYAFNAPETILDGLPLDVVQINNNHSLDVGDEGLERTRRVLIERGFTPTGMDGHATVELEGGTVAVLSYTWGLNSAEGSEHELFVVPFGHVGERIDLAGMERDIASARVNATWVVVLLHWGFEYEYYPDPHLMVLARSMVAAGADVVSGSGPHVLQPAELCTVNTPLAVPGVGTCSVRSDDGEPRLAAVLYSLGNFGTAMATIQAQVGAVASVSLARGIGVVGLGWEAVASQPTPDGGRVVVPLEELIEEEEHTLESERLDQHLGARWRR